MTRMQPAAAGAHGGRIPLGWSSGDIPGTPSRAQSAAQPGAQAGSQSESQPGSQSRARTWGSAPRPLGRTIRVGRPPADEQDGAPCCNHDNRETDGSTHNSETYNSGTYDNGRYDSRGYDTGAYDSGSYETGSPGNRGAKNTRGLTIGTPDRLEELIAQVARGDRDAFEAVYRQLAAPVYGLVRRVLRDPAQSEEVTQEVMVELWRTATRFDAKRGSVRTWALTLAHRRAVDRVRSAQAASDRELRLARQAPVAGAEDDVAEVVEARLDQQRVRHCLGALTELQRESVRLAYYGGYTYREVAELLDAPLGTVKTRLRDGLIRLRDCLGATR